MLTTFESCPLCTSGEAADFARKAELLFVRCAACSLVYKKSMSPSLLPKSKDDGYDEKYFRGKDGGYHQGFEHRVRKALREIRLVEAQGWKPAGAVLDIGCGYGYVIEAARRKGLRGLGLDISPHAVAACRERGYEAQVGPMEQIPLKDGEVQLVTAKHVFEHTLQPSKALEECRRVLAAEGYLYLSVPNMDYWKARVFKDRYRYFAPDGPGWQHHVYYTQETLTRMLESHRFQVLKFVSSLPLLGLRSALGFRHELAVVAKTK